MAIGAFLLPVVKSFIVLLYAIAKPISMILDCTLGGDVGQIYDRNELVQLLDVHAERGHETGIGVGETKLMRAAMEFSTASVQVTLQPCNARGQTIVRWLALGVGALGGTGSGADGNDRGVWGNG